jgi:hypothetical protein
MPRYSAAQQYHADSSFTGRGLGVRHRGGGRMLMGGKGTTPTGGFARSGAGLQIMGMKPRPGALALTGGKKGQ